MIGFGGITVENNKDVVFGMCPLTSHQCKTLLQQLKGTFLLNERDHDLNAFIDLIMTISNFAMSASDYISELDLNPIIVHPPGQGVSVVDALMVKSKTVIKNKD